MSAGAGSSSGETCQSFAHSGHNSWTVVLSMPHSFTREVKIIAAVPVGRKYHPRQPASDRQKGGRYAGAAVSEASSSSLYRLRMVTSEMLATSLTSFWVTFSLVSKAAA